MVSCLHRDHKQKADCGTVDVDANESRIENLERLIDLAQARSSKDREFKRAVGALSDDLHYIMMAL